MHIFNYFIENLGSHTYYVTCDIIHPQILLKHLNLTSSKFVFLVRRFVLIYVTSGILNNLIHV